MQLVVIIHFFGIVVVTQLIHCIVIDLAALLPVNRDRVIILLTVV